MQQWTFIVVKMLQQGRAVSKTLSFLSRWYRFAFWVSLLYAGLIVCVELIVPSDARFENFGSSALILVECVSLFCWANIYELVRANFSNYATRANLLELRKISFYLLTSFCVDLLGNFSWIFSWPQQRSVDWDRISIPVLPQNPIHYLFEWSGVFFKLIHFWKHFLFPGVHGTGALILALILFYQSGVMDDSKREH
jgi:hypothetical protein